MPDRGIRPLPDGRFQAYVFAGGREIRRVFATKTLARSWRTRTLAAYQEGRLEEEVPVGTFKAAVADFLEWSKQEKRPSTYRNDLWVSKSFLKSKALRRPLGEITPAHVQAFKGELLAAGASHRTVDVHLARLSSLFGRLVALEQLPRNPVEKVPLFRDDDRRTRHLTGLELAALLAAASPRLRQIILFAVHTGARKGEIQALRWSWVHLTEESPGIWRGYAVLPAARVKGKRRRILQINADAGAILRAQPEPISQDLPVFPGAKGGRFWRLDTGWQAARRRAVKGDEKKGIAPCPSLEGFRFHDLRHTFASDLAMRGQPLLDVRDLLGQTSIALTERYAHLQDDRLRAAVASLETTPAPKPEPTETRHRTKRRPKSA